MTNTTKRTVPGDGPFNAPLLHIGEAPGYNEVKQNLPFVGLTGQAVRDVYKHAGLDIDKYTTKDVRFNNVIPYNPGTIPNAHVRDELVLNNWANIDADLIRMRPRVIVACGGAALRRLTGLSNISDEHGSVIRASDLPQTTVLRGVVVDLKLPQNSLIIPCLHPAGIMKTKIRAEWVQCRRVMTRAAEYAAGKQYVPDELYMTKLQHTEHDADKLNKLLEASSVLSIDTEFDPDTHIPFAIGLLTDAKPNEAYWFGPGFLLLQVLRKHLKRSNLTKVSHYNPAEHVSLAKVDVDAKPGPWWDTLLGYATLYPDVNVGLSHCALYYLDNERNWKNLETTDPWYLAKDVRNTYRCFLLQRDEMSGSNMIDVFLDEVMPAGVDCYAMEQGGIKIDPVVQQELLDKSAVEREALSAKIVAAIGDSARRVKRSVKQIETELKDRLGLGTPWKTCIKHPTYWGVRAKRFAADSKCTCKDTYDRVSALIEREPLRPFNPGNNHDLRWLLYEVYKLPTQKLKGAVTANANAIRKLAVTMIDVHAAGKTKSVYYKADAPEIVQRLTDIKRVQHLAKMESTFLQPPVDEHGMAHPPIRCWGTGTGRPAGGFDESVASDGAVSAYSFNMLNIRKGEGIRRIFVPGEL